LYPVFFKFQDPSPFSLQSLDTLVAFGKQVVAEPVFDSLRTKQQLGYSVSAGVRLTSNVLGFAFTVLSGFASAVLLFFVFQFDLRNALFFNPSPPCPPISVSNLQALNASTTIPLCTLTRSRG
jgi:hypothetical protein